MRADEIRRSCVVIVVVGKVMRFKRLQASGDFTPPQNPIDPCGPRHAYLYHDASISLYSIVSSGLNTAKYIQCSAKLNFGLVNPRQSPSPLHRRLQRDAQQRRRSVVHLRADTLQGPICVGPNLHLNQLEIEYL